MRRLIPVLLLAIAAGLMFAAEPAIANLQVSQRTDGSRLVDITYDLIDSDSDDVEITLAVSDNDGVTWNVTPNPANLSGDIGETVEPGTGKAIVWDISNEGITLDGDQYRFSLIAEDVNPPDQPGDPSPDNGAINQSVMPVLQWTCSDADNDDLTYDVYFGTTTNIYPDSLVAEDLTETSFMTELLQSTATYYWIVVASDGEYETRGNMWSFTTLDVPDGFVYAPAGTLQMGWDGFAEPIHTVELDAFFIGKYEVTQQEWIDVMGSNPSYFTGDMNLPVDQVNWYDAVKYCNYRSLQEGLSPVYSISGDTNPNHWSSTFTPVMNWNANGYRLPTEAEWEYAARGTSSEQTFLYAGSNHAEDVAWITTNSGPHTNVVGGKDPNSIGTYDMSGNVWEWCWDWFAEDYYQTCDDQGTIVNPEGPQSGTERVSRGGSWTFYAEWCRVAVRHSLNPSIGGNGEGFRLVRKAN